MIQYKISYSLLIALSVSVLSMGAMDMSTVNAKEANSNETLMQQFQTSENGHERDRPIEIEGTDEVKRNHPPQADAGKNVVVKESENARLDGTNTNDADGDKLSYSWRLVSPKNLKINLDNDNSATPGFAAPSLEDAKKLTLVFELSVSDGDFQSRDIVRILVTAKNNDKGDADKLNTLTIIDSGTPAPKDQVSTLDVCGGGSNAFTLLVQGVKWTTFPVSYGLDASASSVDERTAVKRAFQVFDNLGTPAGTMFKEVTYGTAQIKVNWKYIDGPYNQLGKTTFSYRTDTHAMTSASITFDRGDKFFISPVEKCGPSGNQFDMQNIATHEIGHAINFGHVSDRLQSMFPTAYAGETLKRTLGSGDIAGMTSLYRTP